MPIPLTKIILFVLALTLGANGASMLLGAEIWFNTLPGVIDTGPFNGHLVRDVGAAYLSASASLALSLRYPLAAFPLLLTGSVFLGLHALLHVWDSLVGRLPLHHLVSDFPGVMLPALLTLFLAFHLRSLAITDTSSKSKKQEVTP